MLPIPAPGYIGTYEEHFGLDLKYVGPFCVMDPQSDGTTEPIRDRFLPFYRECFEKR